MIDYWVISCEISVRWMSFDLTDDKSTLAQVMAWCHQATSHYLNQCWPRSLSPYGFTRLQWVNPCCAELNLRHIELYLHLLNSSISQYWNDTGRWNLSLWKKRNCLHYIFITMVADDQAIQGAKASVAAGLTLFSWNIWVSVPQLLTNLFWDCWPYFLRALINLKTEQIKEFTYQLHIMGLCKSNIN